jgi:hypothetical protein
MEAVVGFGHAGVATGDAREQRAAKPSMSDNAR